MAIKFGPNIRGNIVDVREKGPGAVARPRPQTQRVMSRNTGMRTEVTPRSGPMPFQRPALTPAEQFEDLRLQKEYLQQQPTSDGRNLYQVGIQSLLDRGPEFREAYVEKYPIGGRLNIAATTIPEQIASRSIYGRILQGLGSALGLGRQAEAPVVPVTQYGAPADTPVRSPNLQERMNIFEDPIKAYQGAGIGTGATVMPVAIENLPAPVDQSKISIEELQAMRDRQQRYIDQLNKVKSGINLGTEVESVDPLTVSIKPKQKPGIEQLVQAMNMTTANQPFNPPMLTGEMPIGRVSSARLPGQMGTVPYGYEMSALDVLAPPKGLM